MMALGLTAQERDLRSTGIGSSDIAALVDEHPDRSALDVFLEKTGREEFTGNRLTRMGHRAEEMIADEFAFTHGVTLARCTTVRDARHPLVVATPDRRIEGRDPGELVELKRVGYLAMRRWTLARGGVYRAPDHVQIQGQWQCRATGAHAFYVAADIGGRDWYDERFDYDSELVEGLVEIADRFWTDHVLTDRPPDPDGSKRARERLQAKFPKATRALMRDNENVALLARAYAQAHARMTTAKKEKERAANGLRAAIGEHRGVEADWGRVIWDAHGKGRTAWAAVAKEARVPETIVAKHTKPPTRALAVRVYELEDEDEDDGEETWT